MNDHSMKPHPKQVQSWEGWLASAELNNQAPFSTLNWLRSQSEKIIILSERGQATLPYSEPAEVLTASQVLSLPVGGGKPPLYSEPAEVRLLPRFAIANCLL